MSTVLLLDFGLQGPCNVIQNLVNWLEQMRSTIDTAVSTFRKQRRRALLRRLQLGIIALFPKLSAIFPKYG